MLLFGFGTGVSLSLPFPQSTLLPCSVTEIALLPPLKKDQENCMSAIRMKTVGIFDNNNQESTSAS